MSGLSDKQALATTPALTAWVGASAGTGKTHVLTSRVLRLMLSGAHPNQILCLTFTKTAAAEMKNRLLKALASWVTLSDDALRAELQDRTGEQADSDMLIRSRQLFAEVLDLPGGLAIQNFHSFCQSLLGRFPLESGIRPGFEAIEETAMLDYLHQARDRVLASTRSPQGAVLAEALNLVASLAAEETFDKIMQGIDKHRGKLRHAMRSAGNMDQALIALLWRSLGTNLDEKDKNFIELIGNISDREQLKKMADSLAEKSSITNDKTTRAIYDLLADPDTKDEALLLAYQSVFLTAKSQSKAIQSIGTKKILEEDPEFLAVIKEEQDRLVQLSTQQNRVNIALRSEAIIRLGLAMMHDYENSKKHQGVVDFDDMIAKTVELLNRPDIAPWVLYKLDGSLQHILVDEAQDSNALQWQVVEKLSSEFYVGDSAQEKSRTLFAVGDAKQSIYRFQGADPDQFSAARDRVFAKAEEAGLPFEEVPLNMSYRSGKAVLTLVDSIFRQDGPAFNDLTRDNNPITHDFHRMGHGGLVELWPTQVPVRQEEQTPWQLPIQQEQAEDAAEHLAWRIARHIHSLIGKGVLESKGRLIGAGDILVLVQTRSAFVDYFVRALKVLNVPVSGRDRMTLTQELPVMDLLALGRFALQPDDDLTLATVLKSPFIGMSEEDLFEISIERKASLWQSLKQFGKEKPVFEKTVHYLREILSSADTLSSFEFYQDILGRLGGRKLLASRLSDEINDPIDEFLEQALAFEKSQAPSLEGFVDATERGDLVIKRDMEEVSDCVRVMTVHGAKGLQAPIVYLPDTIKSKGQSDPLSLLPGKKETLLPIWRGSINHVPETQAAEDAVKQLDNAEYRRKLYVALTRAEDRLYISGWETLKKTDEACWYRLIESGFKAMPDVTSQTDKAGNEVLQYRVKHVAALPSLQKEDVECVEKPALPDWVLAPIPSEPAPARPLAPSRPSDAEPAVNSPLIRKSDQRFKRGRLIHALMQWLPDVEQAKRADLAAEYLAQVAHGLSAQEQEKTWNEVERILNDDKFAAIFGSGSRAEVSLSGLVGETTISAQVDRLLVEDDRVLIIDYKSNRPPPVSDKEVPEIYIKQMRAYAEALRVIYPDKKVEAALLWTDEARLMPLAI